MRFLITKAAVERTNLSQQTETFAHLSVSPASRQPDRTEKGTTPPIEGRRHTDKPRRYEIMSVHIYFRANTDVHRDGKPFRCSWGTQIHGDSFMLQYSTTLFDQEILEWGSAEGDEGGG